MIGTSIALDLEPTKDDLLQGPLVVKSGEDPSISADIGLRLTPERFSLAVDMVIPGTEAESGSTEATPKAHFDADIIAKRSDFLEKSRLQRYQSHFENSSMLSMLLLQQKDLRRHQFQM